jgi:hypothetical protein
MGSTVRVRSPAVSTALAGEGPPLGIILCARKNREQIELLKLGHSGIHVAEYLTVLPPKDVQND